MPGHGGEVRDGLDGADGSDEHDAEAPDGEDEDGEGLGGKATEKNLALVFGLIRSHVWNFDLCRESQAKTQAGFSS